MNIGSDRLQFNQKKEGRVGLIHKIGLLIIMFLNDGYCVQRNLQLKDTLGQGVLSFIERFPLFVG